MHKGILQSWWISGGKVERLLGQFSLEIVTGLIGNILPQQVSLWLGHYEIPKRKKGIHCQLKLIQYAKGGCN